MRFWQALKYSKGLGFEVGGEGWGVEDVGFSVFYS